MSNGRRERSIDLCGVGKVRRARTTSRLREKEESYQGGVKRAMLRPFSFYGSAPRRGFASSTISRGVG